MKSTRIIPQDQQIQYLGDSVQIEGITSIVCSPVLSCSFRAEGGRLARTAAPRRTSSTTGSDENRRVWIISGERGVASFPTPLALNQTMSRIGRDN